MRALTDYDRFPEDIDAEVDAFSLLKRTTTFMSSGMTLAESSPAGCEGCEWRDGLHRIAHQPGILSLYNRGDRRRWYWPRPHCGEYFQPCGDVLLVSRDTHPVLASEAALYSVSFPVQDGFCLNKTRS